MIRPAMVSWQDVTERLVALTRPVTEEKRDEVIVNIEKLLDERDKLQPEITAPFTSEEEALGKELVLREVELQKKLTLFTKRIRLDIVETQSKKDHVKSYVNPYGNVARDGVYYDTKQ